MTLEERLDFCKICENRKINLQVGLVCSLTNKKPEFETSTNKLNGISDFSPIEMGALYSDSYSFIQDNPAPMDFCFEFLGKTSKEENKPKRALSEIDRRMERLKSERSM